MGHLAARPPRAVRLFCTATVLAGLAALPSAQGRLADPGGSRKRTPRFSAPALHCLDFEGLARGTRLYQLSTPGGDVQVDGFNPSFGAGINTALVFDSANPTGGDTDLGTPNQDFGGPGIGVAGESGSPFQNDVPKGKVLIVAQNLFDNNGDGLVDSPNDADVLGERLSFDFSDLGAVELETVFLMDVEQEQLPSEIYFYGPGGGLVDSLILAQPGDNGVLRVVYNVQNVERLEFRLNGSAAIDDVCFRQMVDCNGNGIQDHKDIAGGTSSDCNGNGVPDECEPDCDGDGLPDDCDGPDCNSNGVPDNCDIAGGTSLDCNSNGVPDECEPDCDNDGVPDTCDGPDCNGNGVPDSCDVGNGSSPDCNSNGVPDECDIGGGLSPDCNNNGVPDECEPDCNSNGVPDDCDGPDCNANGAPDSCDIFGGVSADCNANGIPDECETDCDGDGVPDECDGPDCNGNGIPDGCDIEGASSADCNFNGVPDECEALPDCNGNGLPDVCDIDTGTSADTNANGVPDECECLSKIGDRVWYDVDRDGIQDPSEPGIEGVTVTLLDGDGNFLATTTTNAKGYYLFSGLCAGIYGVCVDEDTLPPNYVASPCHVGSDDALDSDCSCAVVIFSGDDACVLTVDFGYNSPCTGLIGDFVWYDLDRDGIQDDGEPGIEGVTVLLKDALGSVIASVTTGPFGLYSFLGLCAGTYEVCVDESTLPPGLVASPCNAGGDDTLDNDCSCTTVVLATDDSADNTLDFGYNEPCTGIVGDYVWFDQDENGLQDADEIGIEGVLLELKDEFGTVIAVTTSGPDGDYLFENLCGGIYSVCVDASTLPAGYSPTLCNAGGDDTLDNDCSCATVVLVGDHDTDLTLDFGYVFQPVGAGEGCTPGYWKQSHHFDSWPAPYTPGMLFSDVFEDAFPGKTLLQVLGQGGGGLNALGRHVVAALLNGASGGVNYDLTAAQVITLFDDLFPATMPEYNELKDYFAKFNEQGCPLN